MNRTQTVMDQKIFERHRNRIQKNPELIKSEEIEQLTERLQIALYNLFGYPDRATENEDWVIRRKAYRVNGFTQKAKFDKDPDIRREAYETIGWCDIAKKDEHYMIRIEAYQKLGWDEQALTDPHEDIRLKAHIALGKEKELKNHEDWEFREAGYKIFGWEEKAFEDGDCDIREEAYKKLGYTKKAMIEEADSDIKFYAHEYFEKAREILELPEHIWVFKFTEDEANLLRFNGINVPEVNILKNKGDEK